MYSRMEPVAKVGGGVVMNWRMDKAETMRDVVISPLLQLCVCIAFSHSRNNS